MTLFRVADVMSTERPGSKPKVLAALALLGQLGLAMAVPMVLCAVAGKYLDGWLHGHGVLLIFMILVGIAAGAYGVYLLLAKDLNWKA
jgi:hypothetical protein